MTTLKELEARVEAHVLDLSQRIAGVALSEQEHWTQTQERLLKLRQEVTEYFNGTLRTTAEKPTMEMRHEPWRLPLEQFVNWKSGIEQNWEPNGNARVAQRLAKALARTSGHAEGQLYINWCDKAGRAAVKTFWHSKGFDEVPEGL